MYQATRDLESATWAAAEGRATPGQLAMLEEDATGWQRTLDRLIADTEDNLASVRQRDGFERELAEADIEDDLARLARPRRAPEPPRRRGNRLGTGRDDR